MHNIKEKNFIIWSLFNKAANIQNKQKTNRKTNIEGSIEIGLDKRRYERATLAIIEDLTGKTEKFQILKDKIPSFT